VLDLYESQQFQKDNHSSIFKGNLDTGIDLEHFLGHYSSQMSKPRADQRIDRFVSPFGSTKLNSMPYLRTLAGGNGGDLEAEPVNIDISKDEKVISQQRAMMERYFEELNASQHINLDGSRESESFEPVFSLPSCYEKFRESAQS